MNFSSGAGISLISLILFTLKKLHCDSLEAYEVLSSFWHFIIFVLLSERFYVDFCKFNFPTPRYLSTVVWQGMNDVFDIFSSEDMENTPARYVCKFAWILRVLYFTVKRSCLYHEYNFISYLKFSFSTNAGECGKPNWLIPFMKYSFDKEFHFSLNIAHSPHVKEGLKRSRLLNMEDTFNNLTTTSLMKTVDILVELMIGI